MAWWEWCKAKAEKPKQKAEIGKAEMGQSRLQAGAPDF